LIGNETVGTFAADDVVGTVEIVGLVVGVTPPTADEEVAGCPGITPCPTTAVTVCGAACALGTTVSVGDAFKLPDPNATNRISVATESCVEYDAVNWFASKLPIVPAEFIVSTVLVT
jgi:hypothetical protein